MNYSNPSTLSLEWILLIKGPQIHSSCLVKPHYLVEDFKKVLTGRSCTIFFDMITNERTRQKHKKLEQEKVKII